MAQNSVRHADIVPAHPGELLREVVLPATDLSKVEIARMLGVSRQQLYDILKEKKPVTPDTAVRLGKLFGNGPGIWLRMQAERDLYEAERRVDVSNIPTIEAA